MRRILLTLLAFALLAAGGAVIAWAALQGVAGIAPVEALLVSCAFLFALGAIRS